MQDMSDTKYDSLICGNCGHDGGRAHQIQVNKLEQALIKAQQKSNETYQHKYSAFAISTIVCIAIMSVTYGCSRPSIPESPETALARESSRMYYSCIGLIPSMDKQIQPEALEDCNKTFQNYLNKKKETITNEED